MILIAATTGGVFLAGRVISDLDTAKSPPAVFLTEWEALRRNWTAGSFEAPDLRALHEAIAAHDADAVSTLLARGVSPNIQRDDGTTPLLLAFRHDAKIFRLLLDAGADPSIPIHVEFRNYGLIPPDESVLTLAAAMDGPWFEILQEYPIDVNHRGHDEKTVTHRLLEGIVPWKQKIQRLLWLIENGADLHLENRFHEPPLDREKFGRLIEFATRHSNPSPQAVDRLKVEYQRQFGDEYVSPPETTNE